MTRKLALFGLFAWLGGYPAVADVVTFDTINTGGSYTQIPANYAGFNWSSQFYVINNGYYNSAYGDTVAFPSAPNAAFNASGVMSVNFGGADFSFQGADFASFVGSNSYQAYSSTSVTVEGYLGGVLQGTATETLQPDGSFTFLNADFANIDTVDVLNDGINGHWWLMDNLTYNGSNSVPEPSALMLSMILILGLAVLARVRKQRRS